MRYWDMLSEENVGEFKNNLSLTDILERKSKLDALEYTAELINNMREAYTRELVINGIKDEKQLNEKITELKKQIEKKKSSSSL
tara:strand:+ start:135 stop:386 length:252 start_codon:yes stop_codon:yes gene_type:complete